MKYEVPVCEIIKFSVEDVITTSNPVTSGEKPVHGDSVIIPVDSAYGNLGGESN